MLETLKIIFNQFLNSNPWDIAAFVLSLAYIILATRKNILCWYFAFVSSLIYVFLCFYAKLYVDSILQVFYVILAVWGWISWRKNKTDELEVVHISFSRHVIYILGSIIISIGIGYLFDSYTDQAFPYIDSAIFVFSILATYLISIKVIENWLYFVVIDAVAVPIYWSRGLNLMSVLFIIFTIMAIYGYFSWLKLKRHA
ncbi:MAG: nicotinamide riboside transporter PnuC [Flavobacteriia bacterium]|jgi:nicotinamide mononucleotide transporter